MRADMTMPNTGNHRKPDPAYKGVRYFEMYPLCNSDKPVRISFNDKVVDINKRLKGIVHKDIWLDGLSKDRVIQGLKTDIQTKLNLWDKLKLKDVINWNKFTDYRYCIVQLNKYEPIDLFAIAGFNDENKSKVVTDNGEITLYDLCVSLKLFGIESATDSPLDMTISSELLEGIMVILFDGILCFIRCSENASREEMNYRLSRLSITNIKSIMGKLKFAEIGGQS